MEKYQTLKPRFFALIIDGIVLIPLSIINIPMSSSDLPPTVVYLWLLVTHLASPFYTVLMHGLCGQTLGKMLFKVKVLDTFENEITFYHAVLRSLPQIVFGSSALFASMSQMTTGKDQNYISTGTIAGIIAVIYILWELADIIVFFNSDKRRALHDFIAGTVVIKTDV